MDREFHYFFLFFQIRTQVYTYATHLHRTFGIRRSTVSLEIIRPPRPIRASGYPGIRRRILKSSFPSNPFPEPAMQTALLLDTINGSVRRTDRVSTLTKQMLLCYEKSGHPGVVAVYELIFTCTSPEKHREIEIYGRIKKKKKSFLFFKFNFEYYQ